MTLHQRLLAEIADNGPLSFSRYMELALYDPHEGFYAHGGAGRSRDFLTSPEVGPLFGHVVSQALDSWWNELDRPDPFYVIEVGAGPGSLARGIRHGAPECAGALRYVMVDRSAGQRQQQLKHLPIINPTELLAAPPGSGPLFTRAADLPPTLDGVGVVLANELLDNLPFDLFEYDLGAGWQEVRVGAEAGELTEELCATDFTMQLKGRQGDADERMRVPRQHNAQAWLHEAKSLLKQGRVVVFDYMVESYPVGQREWLRTYQHHERGVDPLIRPGSQDITADVAIDQLAAIDSPVANRTQAVWLRHHGITELVAQGRAYWEANASTGDLAAVRYRSRISESEALLDGAGLGGFRVLEWLIG